MTKQNKQKIWIVVGVIFLITMSSEFAVMARQIGLKDALVSFLVVMILVAGIIYWIRRSKK